MASASTSSKARHFGNTAPAAAASSSTGLAPASSHPSTMAGLDVSSSPYRADGPRSGGAGTYSGYPQYDYSFQAQAGSSSGGSSGLQYSHYPSYPNPLDVSGGAGQQLSGTERGGASDSYNKYPYNTYLSVPRLSQYSVQSGQSGNCGVKTELSPLSRGEQSWAGEVLHTNPPYPSPSQDAYGYDYDPSAMGRHSFHPPSSLLPPQAHSPPGEHQSVHIPAPQVARPTPVPQSPPKAERKPEKIPRPPNAWILYRSDMLSRLRSGEKHPHIAALGSGKGGKGIPQSDISKVISQVWKSEPADVRAQWERKAREAKADHEKMYPNYKFQPKRKEEKLAERAAAAMERENRKRSKEARTAARGAARRRRGRSPTGDADHPYHLGMTRSSSYAGASNHPPDTRVPEYYWNPTQLGHTLEGHSESEDDRKASYPYAPAPVQTLPLGAINDMFAMPAASQKTSPATGSPIKSYAQLSATEQQPQQQEWYNPPPEPSPISNYPAFSPFRPMEGQAEVKATTVPYIFKPINAQPIMLPAEYAPLSNEGFIDDEEILASAWVDMAQISNATPGNEQGFASFNFENITDPDSWTAHENAHLPISATMFSSNVRDFIQKDWDAQRLGVGSSSAPPSSEMYVGLQADLPSDYDYASASASAGQQQPQSAPISQPDPKPEDPVLPNIPLSPVESGMPSGWMSPTSALAAPRTFSETFPGLDSQLLNWGGDAFNEADISGALETLDSIPDSRKVSAASGASGGSAADSAGGASAASLFSGAGGGGHMAGGETSAPGDAGIAAGGAGTGDASGASAAASGSGSASVSGSVLGNASFNGSGSGEQQSRNVSGASQGASTAGTSALSSAA